MKLTFPENLQNIVDEAFWSQNPVAACYAAKADIRGWPTESHLRLAIAKAILSSVGYTEPEPPFVLPTPPPGKLRGPLAAISAQAETLAEGILGPLSPAQAEAVRSIRLELCHSLHQLDGLEELWLQRPADLTASTPPNSTR